MIRENASDPVAPFGQGMRGLRQVIDRRRHAWALLGLLCVVPADPSLAHHRASGPTGGIAIRSLTHGQLAVVAVSRNAILRLADRQPRRDETLLRLRNFAGIQHMACWWGIMPGSLSDEASPFNECSHAYLSAAYAVLEHLQGAAADPADARAMMNAITLEMLAGNAAPVSCAYSGEAFSTAEVIQPDWRALPSHAASMLALGAVAVPAFGGLAALGCLLRRRPHGQRPSARAPGAAAPS